MPYHRRRKPVKKTRRNFRRNRRNYVSKVYRMPFARSTITTLRYVQRIELDPGALGTTDWHTFRMNSIFDPDYTSTGHQPMGHDQYATLYHRYLVLGAKMTVQFVTTGTTVGTGGNIVGLRFDKDATASADIIDTIEHSDTKYRVLSSSESSAGKVTITQNFSTKKFFAVKRYDQDHSAIMSNNPARLAYCHMFCGPLETGIDTSKVACLVTINYLVKFSEPIDLTGS